MKNIVLLAFLLLGIQSFSQRVGIIESEKILNKTKSYEAANKKLEDLSMTWKKEIDNKMDNLDMLYKKFQAEQSLYTESMKQDKIKEIDEYEKSIAELQQQRFGPNGDLFKQRQQLLQPIIAKMVEAVKTVAAKKSLDLVLDKSVDASIIYFKETLNISDDVINSLGY